MAEAVFDDHPLEEYFRLSGEDVLPIPGGISEFSQELDESIGKPQEPLLALERLPPSLVNLIQIASSFFECRQSSENAFAERFKYDVISSSLLSATVAATPTIRRTFTLEPDDASDVASSDDDKSSTTLSSPLSEFQVPMALVCVAAVALAAEYYFVAIFLMLASAYAWHSVQATSEIAANTTSTLDAVNQLIRAGNIWDSAVNEAITIVEKEERSIFYGPSSPRSPSSGLRVTLQSSLHTTQNQCDNVRQLLSALTDPSQLSQISEMYAPSSPPKPAFSILDHPRPLSIPMGPLARSRTISTPTNKRSTWNGSYAALAQAGSPLTHIQKRRSRRSADLTALFEPPPSKFSMSAPASPQRCDPVQEEQEEEDTDSDAALGQAEYFGSAALDLQRKRRSAGMEAFGVPPPSYATSARHLRRTSVGQQPTIASSSRLTTVHTTRHPLSLTGLRFALHGALSAKRYACSHLLALRFGEDEDDTYWEDVRSMVSLLTSTFEDASARLTEALDIAEKNRVKDERPSPQASVDLSAGNRSRPVRTMAEMVSFAPMPSHLTRFAAHVDAMSTALNDAREHLEQCVTTLRDTAPGEAGSSSDADGGASAVQEHPAFQAYDRLRKELGYALRECERGRERLLDIISGPRQSSLGEEPDSPDDTPGLRNDNGSDTSEKPGPSSPASHAPGILSLSDRPGALGLSVGSERPDEELDDATAHLLLTTSSRHLPPPGVEQVYEADTGGAPSFARERSKLSREERIQQAKARREGGRYGLVPLSEVPSRPQVERWGPGGEVVQELKDVIWKVGEKRRQLTEQPATRPEQATVVSVDDTPQIDSSLLESFELSTS
ncbi:uncharacterized protein B0H18DRAFT_930516 [Fomitopsis serialis]|uniref:uncharacterized protein n=1 Tax=Fomitopsis serialis TaxID=139415 RepID=UPI0020086C85|nr:uncharacterized protein B0H18DRAFT_930516 [Neoantrodia serialis]KAH9930256.1 hypothetical protein B0H18DRAFT_930516 [Neoantrodia serialis]